jgi:hypothetical protein
MEDITFEVTEGGVKDQGHFKTFPIHCDERPNVITVSPDPSIPTIDLSTFGQFQLAITNLSSNLSVTVNGTPRLTEAPEEYWETSEFASINDSKDLQIPAAQTVHVTFHIQPKRVPALLLTLHSFKGNEAHATIRAVFSYNTDKGGGTHTLEVPMHVRFAPSC